MELDGRTRLIIGGGVLLLVVIVVVVILMRGRRRRGPGEAEPWPQGEPAAPEGAENDGRAIPIPIGSRPWQGGGA